MEHTVLKKKHRKWVEGMFVNSEYQLLWSDISEDKETEVFLVKFGPGGYIPTHDHPGREYCYVLEGSMQVGDDILYPGDFLTAGKDEVHEVTTQEGVTFFILIEKPIDILEG